MQRVNGAVLMAAAMLATFWATGVDANSHGAPITACADMGTVHVAFLSKDPATCPFGITFAQTEVNKGGIVQVTLSANAAHDDPQSRLPEIPGYFTGYLLMAFNAEDEEAGSLGTFSGFNLQQGQHLNCWDRPMSALTHVNANFKPVIQTQWVPPEEFVGTVIFRATFTSNIATIWAAVPAHSNVTIRDDATTPTTTTTTTPTTTTTTTTTTTPTTTTTTTPTTTTTTTPTTTTTTTPTTTTTTTPTTTTTTTPTTTTTTTPAPTTLAAPGRMSGSWIAVAFALVLAAMPFLPTL